MCREGVRAFVSKLQDQGTSDLEQGDWCAVVDGFGHGKGSSQLLIETCPVCREPFPIVKRVLQSDAYNLPDVAVYHRLRLGAPCVALGEVTSKTTASRDPDNHPSLRAHWQGLMWYVYDVAFVDVVNGKVKEFCPQEDWGIGGPPPELSDIVVHLQEPLKQGRREGRIPVGSKSVPTEPVIEEILTPVLCKYGYQFAGSQVCGSGFWCGFKLDLLYRRPKDNSTIGIEVKVREDWEHPINQPLKNLVHRNAVLGIRVPSEKDPLDRQRRALATKAESMLEATGSAAFVYVWPEGAEPKV